jgi:hypothetical protein
VHYPCHARAAAPVAASGRAFQEAKPTWTALHHDVDIVGVRSARTLERPRSTFRVTEVGRCGEQNGTGDLRCADFEVEQRKLPGDRVFRR